MQVQVQVKGGLVAHWHDLLQVLQPQLGHAHWHTLRRAGGHH